MAELSATRSTTLLLPRAARYGRDLVLHLVQREFQRRYRRAVFGWVWAVAQPLARIAVLAFVFSQVVRFDIPDYPLFLFVGVISWTWFASAVASTTTCAVDRRDLLFRPGTPRLALPITSILTDLLDYLLALPVLLVILAVAGPGLSWHLMLLPGLLCVQFVLILGIGSLLCAANVAVRDVHLLVDVALLLGFYLTPVFYDLSLVPEEHRWVFMANPMTHLVDAQRAVLLNHTMPDAGSVVAVLFGSALLAAIGITVFRRHSTTFVDEL